MAKVDLPIFKGKIMKDIRIARLVLAGLAGTAAAPSGVFADMTAEAGSAGHRLEAGCVKGVS
ncbi:hypothetical protein [Brevundimonas sp. R86498]|uniref:hypothetical protein n=1 Tax=Brevundimonas sp. R86498 TaxID=3093845 RepID=UPI0037C94835